MNRYSNYTPSAYNPLSLEEIAMVPAMKRKQHDALLAQQEVIKSGLAKTDPYTKHFDEALNLKRGIESKIDTTAGELATNGVNNDMIGKTIALNREYQDLMSPTGKLGQINAEKINIAKINEDYDKMAAAQKWSPAESDYWKSKAIAEYNDVDKNPIYDPNTGRINAYKGPIAAPTRVNYAEKFDSYASKAGMSAREFANAAQELARDEVSGQASVKGSSYAQKWGKNTKQVLAAYDTMKREMQDTSSDVHKSMVYERRDPNDLLGTIERQKDIYLKDTSAIETGSTVHPFGDPTPPNTGTGTIITNDTTIGPDTAGHDNYTDALNEFKNLESKPNRTENENARLADLRSLRQDADAKLHDSEPYNQILDKSYRKARAIEAFTAKNFTKDGTGKLVRKPGSDSYVESHLNTMQNEYGDLLKEKQKLKDNAWKQSSSLRHNYSYMPKTEKEQGEWDRHNENVFEIMKGAPLGNILDLTSIETSGGTRKDLSNEDSEQVQELLRSGDPKSFKISNIKTYGDNRAPEITMSFKGGKDANSHHVDRWTGFDDTYGGSEAPVTVTFRMKRFSNAFDTGSAAGYKSLSGALADFWKNKGGVNKITGNFQGKEVSNSLIENRYADVSNEELKKRAVVDEDAREALAIRTAKHQAKKGK